MWAELCQEKQALNHLQFTETTWLSLHYECIQTTTLVMLVETEKSLAKYCCFFLTVVHLCFSTHLQGIMASVCLDVMVSSFFFLCGFM